MSQTNVNVPGGSSDEGMGAGMIVGLILAVIVIGFLVWWFLLNGGGGNSTPADSSAPLQSVVESILPTVRHDPALTFGVGSAPYWAVAVPTPFSCLRQARSVGKKAGR